METTTHVTFTQHDKANQYTPGPCTCFQCSVATPKVPCNADENQIRDWSIGSTDCCGGWCTVQNVCVPVNPAICKTKSFISARWDKVAPNVKCFYDLSKLHSNIDEITVLTDRFGVNQRMMWDICKYPMVKNGQKFNAIHLPGKKGDLCRNWWHQLPSHQKTKFIREYCVMVPDAQDCKCANRGSDPVYQEIKKLNAINDGCWYAPCADTVNQFVESGMIKPKCPTIHCSSFIKIMNNKGDVNVTNLNSKIICGKSTTDDHSPNTETLLPLNSLENNKSFLMLLAATALTAAASLVV